MDISQWPPTFKRLVRIFSSINTHLSFLLSHSRSSIPSYEHFKFLVPDLTIEDLAIIKYFFGEIFFDYVQKEDLFGPAGIKYTQEKGYHMNAPDGVDDMYSMVEIADQILLFTFEDMKLDNIAATFKGKSFRNQNIEPNTFFNHKDLNIQKLTNDQLVLVIKTRMDKFVLAIDKFLNENNSAVIDEIHLLHKLRENLTIPQRIDLTDPVEQINKRRKLVPNRITLTCNELVTILKNNQLYRDQIVLERPFTLAKAPQYELFDTGNIHPVLAQAIKLLKGIDIATHLYRHQAKALNALINHDTTHVITSTPTSSGKSFIYQIPILNDILWDIDHNRIRYTTAIFIFPTKALAQDQKKHIQDLINYFPSKYSITVDTYDGDTEQTAKSLIRNQCDIIFTNPDTLHASILPNHDGLNYGYGDGWQRFLISLKYVIVDEIHIYRGSFGINVSYVMARLLRVLDSFPQHHKIHFISSSATVLNPKSHFRTICSIPSHEDILHIDEDGSGSCEKLLLIWQPPPLMNKRGQILSPDSNVIVPRINNVYELARILLVLLSGSPHIKVIVFCPIRKITEILMKEIRTLLRQSEFQDKNIDERDIMVYRGGYSKADRRIIEQKMFSGELRAIVATNALELGIDLSYLDVVIACGFPILKMNMHQQFGRAGRGKDSKGSLAIFVAGSVPVDQYYLNHPEEILDKSNYEDLCVDGLIGAQMHKLILERHLQCAAFELPLRLEDSKWFCNGTNDPKRLKLYKDLCSQKLNLDKFGKYRVNPAFLPWPPEKVALRAIELPGYVVVDISNGRNVVIEEVEESRTSFTLYEGGIFLHQGLPYLVKELNTDKKFAKVIRVNVDWITQQRDFSDIDPVEIEFVTCLKSLLTEIADVPAYFGKVLTTIIVFGFFKVNKKGEILEAVEVKNPPVKFLSKGFWLDIPQKVLDTLESKQLSKAGAIHAAQHTIMNILPIFISGSVSTDANSRFTTQSSGQSELSTECKAPEKEFAKRQTTRIRPGRLIFYDSKGGPEGLGVSAKAFEYINEILMAAYERVHDCECKWGCLKCITPSFCKEGLQVMSKPGAFIILGSLVGRNLTELLMEVPDGPEENLPKIQIETIRAASSVVKMAKDIEIIDTQPAKSLKPIKREPI